MAAFDFPASPVVGQVSNGYTWDGEKWLLAGYVPFFKKNYVINGAMMVSQENGAAAVGSGGYAADQFFMAGGAGAVYTFQQVASPTPGGSPNRVRVTVTTADAAVAAGDIAWMQTTIEGLRCADLRFGSSAAKTVTMQFGVKAPAGTYGLVLQNKSDNRSYVAEYVISAGEANVDTRKSLTIPGDQTGTWFTDNTHGICIRWGLMAGTTYQQAAGAWGTVNAIGPPDQFNFMGTVGNVFELFDVGLYEGASAPPFVVPDYASELMLCQRYFQTIGSLGAAPYELIATGAMFSSVLFYGLPTFKVRMRAIPTFIFSAANTFSCQSAASILVPSAIGTAAPSVDGTFISCTVAGATAGQGGVLQANAGAACRITISARM